MHAGRHAGINIHLVQMINEESGFTRYRVHREKDQRQKTIDCHTLYEERFNWLLLGEWEKLQVI